MKTCIKCGGKRTRNAKYFCRPCADISLKNDGTRCPQCSSKMVFGAKRCRVCYDFERSHQDRLWHKKEWLEEQYLINKLSFMSIAKLAGCGQTTIEKWMSKFGIPSRPAPFTGLSKGHLNPSWKGGIYKGNGYRFMYHPEPHAYAGRKNYVAEHILVMERKLGRKLVKPECVHHLNGIKDDNQPDNLMLCKDGGQHRIFEEKVNSFGKAIVWGKLYPELQPQLKELFMQFCQGTDG